MKTTHKNRPGFLRLFLPAIFALMPMLMLGGSLANPAQAGAPTGGATSQEEREEVLVVRVYFRDLAERDRLATELGAEEVPTTQGFLTVLTDRPSYNGFINEGLRVEIDQNQTRILNDPVLTDTFYGGYKSVEEIYTFLDQKVAAHPAIAEKVDIGDSWCKLHPGSCVRPEPNNGYDLYVMHITNRAIPGPKPVFWYDAGIHSREIATPEVAMRFIDYLLSNYNTNADVRWLVDYHDIWAMPTFNPDGHHIVEAGGNSPYLYRKNGNNTLGSSCAWPPNAFDHHGVDNNRNFVFRWGCCGGSTTDPCAQTYRGTGAGSEPETDAVMAKIRTLIPDQRGPGDTDPAPLLTTGVYQNIHTVVPVNLIPWGWTTTQSPNHNDLSNIAAHSSSTSASPPGNGYPYGTISQQLYIVDGGSIDWAYGELGAASISTELSGGDFLPQYSCIDNPGCGSAQGIWPENRGMLTYLAKIARTPYLTTRGPDSDTVAVSPSPVPQGTAATVSARLNYAWSGNAYSQNVAAAEYYVDTPPWAGGTPNVMTAVDGSFNSPTEQAQGTIDTTGLTVGRHIVFVRGRGVNSYEGNQSWGPISAAWLDVSAGGTVTPATATPQATPTCSPSGAQYDIAIVFSDDDPSGKLIDYIDDEPDVASVSTINARFSTPSLAELLPYDLVVVYSNTEYDDPVALGNVIADYQDAGGVVVATNANWWGPPYGIEGRWMTGGYTMFNSPATSNNSTSTLGAYNAAHPLMQGVTELTAYFRSEATLTTGATQVAAWADNWPLVAYKTTNGHTAVGINAYLGFPQEGWDGDFGTLIVNAARWLRPGLPCGSPTPQVTSTAPPTGTATRTPAQPTITVIATATQAACTLTFSDVPSTNTFYANIRCLACRGIVSGYADGTFRPNNEVTRGQLAKIVSNAAGFTESPHPQIFEDVPPSNTFYEWINRLTRRGHMTGYACGGVGEPCILPENRPYFRPFANATRGQTSKIVANAAGYIEEPAGQTFEDVPPTHTFYREIQRLASRNIMQGYACGGVGEPCVSGRPYFRPQNNVTRGQSAKIVANTFYPGCETP